MSRAARMALSLIVEPGDPRLRDLMLHHEPGRIVEAIRANRSLSSFAIPEAWAERADDLDQRVDLAMSRATASGLRWVCRGDRQWPSVLDDLDHLEPLHGTTGAPIGLWLRGRADLADLTRDAVAIVGARDCTTYGAECASDLGADLADGGWTVISGAAYGIDGCAHRGALAVDRPTVAVLACGADVDYPRSHSALLARIAEAGLVVSEQPPGASPLKGRFLSRNRLIAALSRGTVVVEAARRSGSLNTLHWADQLGRTTMGLPGPVTSRQSGGVHDAVRNGKAVLVTNGQDVLHELGDVGATAVEGFVSASTEFDRLPPAARATLDGLDWNRARAPIDVAKVSGRGIREVREALALLEGLGLAVSDGQGWRLVRRADLA